MNAAAASGNDGRPAAQAAAGTLLRSYSGATRVLFIVGDPIAQAKAPSRFTAALQAQGSDVVVVPAHVSVRHLPGWFAAVSAMHNCDGVVVTVPHKFAALAYCDEATARARAIGGVNVMRRTATGGWHGDHLDGEGFLAALRLRGGEPAGRRALLVGAGGAGAAIARALADAGPAELAVYDVDPDRQQQLLARLVDVPAVRAAPNADPAAFDIVINASPAGMRPDDALPVPADRLSPRHVVGDVVSQPEITPLIAQARGLGCITVTGVDMFDAVCQRMLAFYAQPA